VESSSSQATPTADANVDAEERVTSHITNVPKYYDGKSVKKMMERAGVDLSTVHRVKKPPRKQFARVVWTDAAAQAAAEEKLSGYQDPKSKKPLACSVPNVRTPLATVGGKRKHVNPVFSESDKRSRTTEEVERTIMDSVCPYWRIPYPEQIAKKTETMRKELERIIPATRRQSKYDVPQWVKEHNRKDGLPFVFEGVIPSPITEGYRNKTEFTIGLDHATMKPAVGFQFGTFMDGHTTVGTPELCPHIPRAGKAAAQLLTAYLQDEANDVPAPYSKLDASGFWRLLLVRTSLSGEALVAIQVNSSGISEEEYARLKEEISKLFLNTELKFDSSIVDTTPLETALIPMSDDEQCPEDSSAPTESSKEGSSATVAASSSSSSSSTASSSSSSSSGSSASNSTELLKGDDIYKDVPQTVVGVFFQDNQKTSNAADDDCPFELVAGKPTISESIMGLQFNVSPKSFFQSNVPAATIVYKTAIEWSASDEGTTLLDICSGTGTIGLSMAGSVKEVVGVEMVEAAVLDARQNAERNHIENVTFYCGKAESIMPTVFAKHTSSNIVGIVDPPRCGLHSKVVKAIRACKELKRLVYVSCNQKALVANAADLCRSESNNLTGAPFKPVKVVGVDMFPHTEHCEAIMLFER